MRFPGVTLSSIADGDTFFSDPGSEIHVLYSPVIDDGCISLVESGKENIQTLIESYRDSTDMTFILSRLAAGDSSPLFRTNPMFGDFSAATYDHAEMLRTVMDARAAFDNLSSDVRAKFDNDFVTWFSSAGSPEWASFMTGNVPGDPSPATSESEVENNES